MSDYPSHFPQADDTSYQGRTLYGVGRTAIPVALANQVKYYNAPRIELSLEFSMLNSLWEEWFTWMRDNGGNWFNLPIVSPHAPVDITSTHRVRTMSGYRYVKRGDNYLTVSVDFELVPGDSDDPLVPAPTYDWVIAQTPASPATDWLIGGTPASPSTGGWVRGELYYY